MRRARNRRAGTPGPEPIDSDVRSGVASPGSTAVVLLAIAAGGALGALARYAVGLIWAQNAGHFPTTTFGINVVGCALIGVLMVVASDVLPHRPLVRLFLGTGVLGGFTTFSTYSVDTVLLFTGGHPGTALAYLAATLVCGLLAVTLAASGTRLAVRGRGPAG